MQLLTFSLFFTLDNIIIYEYNDIAMYKYGENLWKSMRKYLKL